MGLFNDVTGVPPIPCPKCGEPLDRWQTKDERAGELAMVQVPLEMLDHFYAYCGRKIPDHNAPVGHLERRCNGRVWFVRPRLPIPFEAFERVDNEEPA